MNRNELNTILKEHEKWLRGEGGAAFDCTVCTIGTGGCADTICANSERTGDKRIREYGAVNVKVREGEEAE